MRISEARIFNFGKLQNKNYQFAPGINVVYGENEAGKSTLHDFLCAMLFGMEKGRGRAAAGEKYSRYEPWHAPGYYSGALRFFVEGRPFYLERNFYHKEKKEILKNEADGEELSVAYGDLQVLFGGVSKEAFENTYDVPQAGAATGKELADILAEYLSDAAESGDASVRVTRAQNLLNAKKKELNQDLKRIKNEKKQEIHSLMIEKELLERDCRGLQGSIVDAEREINNLKRIRAEEIDEMKQKYIEKEEGNAKENGKQRMAAAVFAVSILVMMINGLVYGYFHYPGPWMAVSELLLAVTGAAAALKWKRESEKNQAQQEEKPSLHQYSNAALMQSERMLKNLRDSLAEKETRRYNIIEKIEAAQQSGEEEQALGIQLKAVELASSQITRLAEEFYEEIQDELNGAVSGWVSRMTGGRYDRVTVAPDGRLQLHFDGMDVPPESLSRGTLEQIYLALRLAVGEIVTREEQLPVFLDETFSMYDGRRLEQALGALSERKEQIFIFTCQRREMELLEKLGISYHKVVLE